MTPDRCPVKLLRCCGEGILTCEKNCGHDGPHGAFESVGFGMSMITEWP